MSVKGVFFDMDGTLISSEKYMISEGAKIIAKFVPGFSEKEYHSFIGLSVHDEWKHLQKNYGLKLNFQDYFEEMKVMISNTLIIKAELNPNVVDVLDFLLQNKFVIGLGTSSERVWQEVVFDRFDLNKYFSAVVTATDVNGEAKPSPRIYLELAEKLNLKPHQGVVIEDTRNGVIAGQKAGIKTIAYRNPENNNIVDFFGADHIISDFIELKSLLSQI